MKGPEGESVGELTLLWPDPNVGPFAVYVTYGIVDGVLSIIGLEIYGARVRPPLSSSSLKHQGGTEVFSTFYPDGVLIDDEPHRIDAKVLRQLAPGWLLEEFKRTQRAIVDGLMNDRGTDEKMAELGRFFLGEVERSGAKRYRSGLGPLHWAKVAEVYRGALLRGEPPTKAVGTQFKVSKQVATKWVAKCRALGLLPPTTQGRSSGKKVATPELPIDQITTGHPRRGATAPSPFVQTEKESK